MQTIPFGHLLLTRRTQVMSSNASEKRKPGRPKGTKNKPDAGTNGRPVGRPRKDATTLKIAPPKLPHKIQPLEKRNNEGAVFLFRPVPISYWWWYDAGNVEFEHAASPTVLDELVQPPENGKYILSFIYGIFVMTFAQELHMCPGNLIKGQTNLTQQVCKLCRSVLLLTNPFLFSFFAGTNLPATTPGVCGTITATRASRTGMFIFLQ